ncbi:glycosyltransferase family 4 protein [Corynebacterium sp.]|uniref:glycosyltransferase family 4 protein n=1 Tax=Corynebacterium sp. TaxID=1720 RepID=UPI0026DAC6E2|nr:glycosyltransferase family 4 protein [Corynebacterium sp.]MDO5075841.1 glycosyltransferase family 4 protein [Corynebacterium sp.]
MNIAYVCVDPGIPVFGTKGACVHMQEVIRELLRRGHNVTVFAVRKGTFIPDDLRELEVREFPIEAKETAERELAQQQRSEEISAEIIRGNFDLIYERYSLFSTVIATSQIPGILEVNAPLIEEQRTHRALHDIASASDALQLQVSHARVTVCVSENVRTWVSHRTVGGRVVTVPNGVNPERIVPQPEDTDGAPVVTFVGTLKPWHGVSDLLIAASYANHPWRIRILGDGPERPALEHLAEKLGLSVDFRGAIAPAEMPKHLAGTAIAVAPYPAAQTDSDQYFSPLKLFEYMAAGLPIVASQVGQIPSILGTAGELVPPSHPEALALAIDGLVADPGRRKILGDQARALAVREHSWQQVVTTMLRLAGVEVT